MINGYKKIYCDFDGTITKIDSVYNFFCLHADENWLDDEKLWQEGKISSRECMERQIKKLPAMDKTSLYEFIETIEIDEYFIEFYNYAKSKGIEIIILSDGLDLFIKETLKKYSLDIKYYANNLVYYGNRFSVNFCNYSNDCNVKAGSCKCSKITEKDFCYIGDGTSDLCVAKKARLLFAKNKLKKHCENLNLKYISFSTFKDILEMFNESERGINDLLNRVNK